MLARTGARCRISSADPQVVERGAALLQESLQLTHDIGATILTGALYSAFGKAAHPLTPAGRANVVAVLKDLAVEAAPLGVALGLEICNRYETNVVNTARDCLRLADDIGADNVVIHLDTYHMNIEEKDLATPVIEVGDRLGYVHIGENDRGYLGSGHIDFPAFFGALADIDYRGAITFESFSSAVVARGLSNDLAIWRNLWDDGADLAGHACRYIVDGLRDARARQMTVLDRLALEAIALADRDSPVRVPSSVSRATQGRANPRWSNCCCRGSRRSRVISGSRMCPWTDFTSPTSSWTGSATATARVPPTPSILSVTGTCWSGSRRRTPTRSMCPGSTGRSNNRWPVHWSCCRQRVW